MVVGSRWRVCTTQVHTAAAVESRLDGDSGVTWTVQPQRLSVTRVSGVAGDNPGQVVCYTR